MVQVASHQPSVVSLISTLVDLTEEQHLCYHIVGSVSEGKCHPQISNIQSSVYVLCGSPQSNTNCLNLLILQDLMNTCCKTVLLKKKNVLDAGRSASKVVSFPKRETVFTVTIVKKILTYVKVFILYLIPQYHSVSTIPHLPACNLYFAASSVKVLSLPLLPFSQRLLVIPTMKDACEN